MTVLAEGKRLYDGLIGEIKTPARFSREEVVIAINQTIPVLSVLGKITKAVPTTGTKDDENAGNGTVTLVSGGDDTQIGTYTLTCITAADSPAVAVFSVVAPNGEALPNAPAGAYTNPQLNFTITDGGTPFEVGDSFTIEVAAGSGQVKPIDFTAKDGSQQAYGIAAADYVTAAATIKGVAFVRVSSFVESALVWPAGATSGQKAKALAELKAEGIITLAAA